MIHHLIKIKYITRKCTLWNSLCSTAAHNHSKSYCTFHTFQGHELYMAYTTLAFRKEPLIIKCLGNTMNSSCENIQTRIACGMYTVSMILNRLPIL